MSDETVRATFRKQADFCEAMAAPVTAAVARGLAEGLDRASATGRAVLDWAGDPIGDALPLRLVGGLHALHRAGRDVGFDGDPGRWSSMMLCCGRGWTARRRPTSPAVPPR